MVARSGMKTTGRKRLVSARWLAAVALGSIVAAPSVALAIHFGQDDAVELRGHFYSQFTVATEPTQAYSQPPIDGGNMKQLRNFYNPELEVDFR
jgi:hypothetical protein